MKAIAISLALTCIALPAFADPQGWTPPKVGKPDKKGVDEAYKAMEDAWKKNDMDAVAATIDFPVYMASDNAAGTIDADAWPKEKWVETMKAAMGSMPKDVKMTNTHKVTFLSDHLAIGEEDHTMVMGKTKSSWKSACLIVKRGDKWMFKSMVEGGWADMGGAKKAEAAPPAAPAAPAAPANPNAPKTASK